MKKYEVGEKSVRPWGSYEVLEVTRDSCVKLLVVEPMEVLSLQSHKYRTEHWEVLSGAAFVIVDGALHVLFKGDRISVGFGVAHTIANLDGNDLLIRETQIGICREDDIVRYADYHCRERKIASVEGVAEKEIELYKLLVWNL